MAENKFVIKDSGERKQFASGMQRDTTEGKTDFTLIIDGPMFKRWAVHLTNGAKKYDKRNWMKAAGKEELDRFLESAFRHFFQWITGDRDEDHAAAVFFNINAAEYVKDKIASKECCGGECSCKQSKVEIKKETKAPPKTTTLSTSSSKCRQCNQPAPENFPVSYGWICETCLRSHLGYLVAVTDESSPYYRVLGKVVEVRVIEDDCLGKYGEIEYHISAEGRKNFTVLASQCKQWGKIVY